MTTNDETEGAIVARLVATPRTTAPTAARLSLSAAAALRPRKEITGGGKAD